MCGSLNINWLALSLSCGESTCGALGSWFVCLLLWQMPCMVQVFGGVGGRQALTFYNNIYKQHSYLDVSRVSSEFKRWASRPHSICLTILEQIAWTWASCHCRPTAVLLGTSLTPFPLDGDGDGVAMLATSVPDQFVQVWSQHELFTGWAPPNQPPSEKPLDQTPAAIDFLQRRWEHAEFLSSPWPPFRKQGAKSHSSNHSIRHTFDFSTRNDAFTDNTSVDPKNNQYPPPHEGSQREPRPLQSPRRRPHQHLKGAKGSQDHFRAKEGSHTNQV